MTSINSCPAIYPRTKMNRKGVSRVLFVAMVVVVVAAAVGGFIFLTGSSTGTLTVLAQDPGTVRGVVYVYVEALQIQAHNVNGSWVTVMGSPKWVRLNYILNTSAPFISSRIPAGTYDELRLVLPAGGALVTVNTSEFPVAGRTADTLANISASVPSGAETGIKIYAQFTLGKGASETVTLHFHLVQTGAGSLVLTPQTSAQVNTSELGSVFLVGALQALAPSVYAPQKLPSRSVDRSS
jgi:hypothetical protein